MIADRINEEMARLDGWVPKGAGRYWHRDGDTATTVPECDDECGGIGGGYIPALPNYVGDLDAVALVEEKVMTTTPLQNAYQANIAAICWTDEARQNNQVVFNQLTASAVQRCEAILRTVRKWEGP